MRFFMTVAGPLLPYSVSLTVPGPVRRTDEQSKGASNINSCGTTIPTLQQHRRTIQYTSKYVAWP